MIGVHRTSKRTPGRAASSRGSRRVSENGRRHHPREPPGRETTLAIVDADLNVSIREIELRRETPRTENLKPGPPLRWGEASVVGQITPLGRGEAGAGPDFILRRAPPPGGPRPG